MEIVKDLTTLNLPHSRQVVALGNFDGLHRGHQKLVHRTVEAARHIGGKSVIFTFEPHPLQVLKPAESPPLIITAERKAAMLAGWGVDILVFVPFTLEFAALSPEEFVRLVLVERIGVARVVVGYNYRFGQKGIGDTQILEELGRRYGFTVDIVPAVRYKGQTVSSSRIRTLVQAGELEEAFELLGYRLTWEGEVVSGCQIGRSIGFPTANLDFAENVLLPGRGVYIAEATFQGKKFPGVANVGIKPTVGGNSTTVEVYLFDFHEDIYGQRLQLTFLRKLRDERQFASLAALKEQIKNDVKAAREFFQSAAGSVHPL